MNRNSWNWFKAEVIGSSGSNNSNNSHNTYSSNNMKPTTVVDEMFPEGVGTYMDEDTGAGIIVDTNREGIHADFYNDFGDIFDDDDLS